jgi:hypothetical protein
VSEKLKILFFYHGTLEIMKRIPAENHPRVCSKLALKKI